MEDREISGSRVRSCECVAIDSYEACLFLATPDNADVLHYYNLIHVHPSAYTQGSNESHCMAIRSRI